MALRVIAISDTHERHSQVTVPPGDLLIHCGDFTNRGSMDAVKSFLDWFMAHPHPNKCFILGNHETTFSGNGSHKYFNLVKKTLDSKTHFLHNSSAEIEGFKIYGSPVTPFFCGWAFNYNRGKDIAAEWAKIPLDTNILITHGPPYGILDLVEDTLSNRGRDLHQGCQDLRTTIQKLPQLKLSLHGHLHTCGGQTEVIDGITYGNAAICTEQYDPTNKAIVIDIGRVVQ